MNVSSSGLNSEKTLRDATRIIFRLARLTATVNRRGSSKKPAEAVAVAVSLALEGFDFVVQSLQRAGRDRTAVVVQQSNAVELEGGGHLLQHRDPRRLGPTAPVVQEAGGVLHALPIPEASELVLHVVGGGQRLVEAQRFLQTGLFALRFVEVLGVLEDQPAGALEDGLTASFGLALVFAAEVGQAFVEELDDVEVVEDVEGVGEVIADGGAIGGRPVGSDGRGRWRFRRWRGV